MTVRSKLKTAADLLACAAAEPELCRLLLRQLPWIAKSRAYSHRWGLGLNEPQSIDPGPRERNSLEDYFTSYTAGPGIWKWLHYFDIYQRHLQKFVGKEVHLLEVGIYSGGSLRMWRDYLGPGCHIYGVDIEPACKAYENDWTQVFIGDQADRTFWQAVRRAVPRLDVLIDDGGHHHEQQIVTLEEMLAHLEPGGVYLCEDMHGEHNWFTSYVRGLASDLNAFTCGPGQAPEETRCDATPFQSRIHSIHAYPFVAVIEKRDRVLQEFIAPSRGTEWQPFPGGVAASGRAAFSPSEPGVDVRSRRAERQS